jgi:hypothetical protein
MAIFYDSDKEFERGTTVTSQLRIRDDEDRITPADTLIIDGDQITAVTLTVMDADEELFIIEEEEMTQEVDDEGEVFYSKSFYIPEDAELGEYHLEHRIDIGGERYKRTDIAEVVNVKNA